MTVDSTTAAEIIDRYSAIVSQPMLIDQPLTLGIRCDDSALLGIDFLPSAVQSRTANTALGAEVVRQLRAYFDDPGFQFDLPLLLMGTSFQQGVWQALRRIASGDRISYGELAGQLRSSARAIGGACRRNPCPIVVPCHRVVARRGLGGFAGATRGRKVFIKDWLLNYETAA